MLISFNFRNFKSFADDAYFTMEAHGTEKTLRSAVIKFDGAKLPNLLPAAAIYGANASGKSNFLLAIDLMADAVVRSQSDWKISSTIRTDPNVENANEPSRFEIEFLSLDSIRYRYGFEAYPTHFSSEWLYSYPKGRERQLFTRTTNLDGVEAETTWTSGANLQGDARSHNSSFTRVRPNSLLLSALAQDNQADALDVYNWFTRVDVRMSDGPTGLHRDFVARMADEDEQYRKLLLPLLKIADSNIVGVKLIKDEKETEISPVFAGAPKEFLDFLKENSKYQIKFSTNVRGNVHDIDYSKQSRGVKRMFVIANEVIRSIKSGGLFVVDELESSLHPHVASQLLALYQNRVTNPRGAQVIFSTHETRLLNLAHLRRDQIWFVEKEAGCSSVYSLLEFSPRKDENFEAGYLRGRYGALPQTAVDPGWMEVVAEIEASMEHVRPLAEEGA